MRKFPAAVQPPSPVVQLPPTPAPAPRPAPAADVAPVEKVIQEQMQALIAALHPQGFVRVKIIRDKDTREMVDLIITRE